MDAQQAERAEIEALASVTLNAPVGIARDLGLHLVSDHGTVMALATSADVLALNRIVGLGAEIPATREQLVRLIRTARERGTKRLFVQIIPDHTPATLGDWIEAEGGRKYNRWVRLWRDLQTLPDVKTDLQIRRIDTEHALRSGEIVAEAFDMPKDLAPWIASTVGRPGWIHAGAFDGSDLVGSAALYVSRKVAWLGFAATLESHRGHGAQGALIRRRMELARELDCESIVVETAEQTPDHSAPSYRNMIRFGFTEAYFRQNYLIDLRTGNSAG